MQAKERNITQLFKDWHGGDANAGNLMAQRFADWYYAIATSRLGEAAGAAPCQNASQAFLGGVAAIKDPRELVKWAHKLISAEVETLGSRATDGDESNGYTGDKRPKVLLANARRALPDEMRLLEAVYGGKVSNEQIDELSESLGGNPLGVLKARYRVKQWLRDNEQVPFEVAPDKPILDRAPLPLYEANRMATPNEEASFEQWMLSDIDLCRDIAEFAVFSIALRGGVPQAAASPKSSPKAGPTAVAEAGGSNAAMAIAGGGLIVGIVIVVIVVLAVAAYFVLG